jgi:hypothetical protein
VTATDPALAAAWDEVHTAKRSRVVQQLPASVGQAGDELIGAAHGQAVFPVARDHVRAIRA